MRSKAVSLLLIGIFIVAGFILILGSPIRLYRDASPARTRADISLNVPRGTSVSKVIKFLDGRNIEHSSYSNSEHEIKAVKRNTCLALLLECNLGMRFAFDEKGRLESFDVDESLTGL